MAKTFPRTMLKLSNGIEMQPSGAMHHFRIVLVTHTAMAREFRKIIMKLSSGISGLQIRGMQMPSIIYARCT